jgi:long-chain acyl-CoA synthetase
MRTITWSASHCCVVIDRAAARHAWKANRLHFGSFPVTLHAAVAIADRWITQSDFHLASRRVARGLHELGVREEDSVAVLMRNDFAVLQTFVAATELGSYAVPFNWHLKTDEIRYLITDARPKVLITHADLLKGVRSAVPEWLKVIVVPTPPEVRRHYGISNDSAAIRVGDTEWSSWQAQWPPWEQAAKLTRGSIVYTSGTTGYPKGVKREPMEPEQSRRFNAMVETLFGRSDIIRAYVGGPLYHGMAGNFSRFASRQADLLILQAHFDPQGVLEAIEREQLTHLVMVPTMFVRMLKLSELVRKRYDVSSLRWVIHTGAPCPPEIKRAMIEWFGPVIAEVYGSTEVGPVSLVTGEDWLLHPGTVGRPLPNTTVRILNDAGGPCVTGEIGEICVRNTNVPNFSYVNFPAARKALERGDLLATGDMGYVDADGYLFLADRRTDLVISGGVNIYPAEIERVLIGMPGVLDCAVFGLPDAEYGRRLAVAIELDGTVELSSTEVRQYLAQRIANYKIPRTIVFDSELPREESGKIAKAKLAARYCGHE